MLTFSPRSCQVGVYGVDADLHYSSIVGVDETGAVIAVGQTKVSTKLTGWQAIVDLAECLFLDTENECDHTLPRQRILLIEDQPTFGGGKKLQSSLRLAQAAGCCLTEFKRLFKPHATYFVQPVTWKGSVPKDAHQARIAARCGMPVVKKGRTYSVEWPKPHDWARNLGASQRSDILDALGLARWGLSQFQSKSLAQSCGLNV